MYRSSPDTAPASFCLSPDAVSVTELPSVMRVLNSQDVESLEAVAALYSGEYLEGKPYDWASAAKTQLKSDFKKLQYCLADEYLANGIVEKVCKAMEKILLYDPYEETAVFRIIQAKLQAGDRVAVIKAYNSYAKILKDDLGILPSEKFKYLIPFAMRYAVCDITQKVVRFIAKCFYSVESTSYTNIGIIDEHKIFLNDTEIKECYICGIYRVAPSFQVSFSTYKSTCTISANMIASEDQRYAGMRLLKEISCSLLCEF